MESTRPIRALIRGLDTLTVLNSRDGATVSEVAQEIRLPRTTVYRILETLCGAGFVFRDVGDDRYRLTVMVRALSGGFDDDAWVNQVARPLIGDLGREIVWPVSVSTLLGTSLIVRESTPSALLDERHSAGYRLPLLSSAAGRVYLSFCPAAQRDTLIEIFARSAKEEDRLARSPRTDLNRILTETRAGGYSSTSRARRLVEEPFDSRPMRCRRELGSSGFCPS
jgi:IclR family mhp operon transcriptional activator